MLILVIHPCNKKMGKHRMSEVNKIFCKNVITVVVKTKWDIRNSWFKNTKTLKAVVLFKASSAFDI